MMSAVGGGQKKAERGESEGEVEREERGRKSGGRRGKERGERERGKRVYLLPIRIICCGCSCLVCT